MGAYLISNWRSSTVSILFDLLLPDIKIPTGTGCGLFLAPGPVAVRAALGHTPIKSRGRVMNVPPVPLAAGITTVIGHRLQIESGP